MKKQFITSALAFGFLCASATATPDFVDMGTSVLWASQPLGVDESHPYGNHYKPGATEPYPGSSYFDIYSLDVDEWGGDEKCDAATAAYGKGVSTPSKSQFEELFAVCDFTYKYDYASKRDVLTLTSKVTGNKIVITGGGYWSYKNDHTDASNLYLLTSTGIANSSVSAYYFSGQAASSKGLENSIMLRNNYATSYSYQILPVFKADDLVKATSITLNAEVLELAVGDVKSITATIEPENVSVKEIAWKSSDEAVATVDADGNVTAVAEGSCEITATTTDGTELSASCAITVSKATPEMKWVDLGLSVLWGEYEIGASNYKEAGNYYAWGTTDNANSWQSAVASAYTPTNTNKAVTAVPRDPSDPTKAYDVATELLGGEWHTPTIDEWNELLEKCEIGREIVNGESIISFTSKINGNSIYFTGHGYMRETSDKPLMGTGVILQTSNAASNNIYTAIFFSYPNVEGMGRYCHWLVPIRPVHGDHLAAIGSVVQDADRSQLYDVYDISGRKVIGTVNYDDACSGLNQGVYIFVGADGCRLKVSL